MGEPDTWGGHVTLEYGKALRDRGEVGPVPVYGTNGQIGFTTEALCHHDGVIIGRKGAYRGVHYSPEPFFVIDTAFYVEPKADMNMRWAFYAISQFDINGMDSGSAIPSTSRYDFYRLPATVPSRQEQDRIAGILGSLDDKIALNLQLSRTLEELARLIFRAWFVEFLPVKAKMAGATSFPGMSATTFALFPDELVDTEHGELPKGWDHAPVGSVFAFSKAPVSPSSEPDEIFNHYSIPAFDTGGLATQEKGASIMSNKFLVPEGAVLYSKLNPRTPRIWMPDDVSQARAISSTEFLVAVPHDPTDRAFLYLALSEDGFNAAMAMRATGTSTSHQRVTPKTIEGHQIALAPRPVLDALAAVVTPLLAQRQSLSREGATLAATRDLLLPVLLAGETHA